MQIAVCMLHWTSQEVTFSYLTQGGQISGERAIMAVLWFIWVPCTVQENMIFPSGQGILHSRVAGEELSRKLRLITASIAEIQSAKAHIFTKTQGGFHSSPLKAQYP